MASQTTYGSVATKEIKVGLAVIAVLALALAWVVARRLLRAVDVPNAAIESFSSQEYESNLPSASADPQPMILPPSDRYLGPAAYVEPRRLAPTQSPTPTPAPSFDHRPSLLPALPKEDRAPRTAALPVVESLAPSAADRGPIRDVPVDDALIGEVPPARHLPLGGAALESTGPGQKTATERQIETDTMRPEFEDKEQRTTGAADVPSRRPTAPRRRRAPFDMTDFTPPSSDVVPTAVALLPKRTRESGGATTHLRSQPPRPFASGQPEILPVNHADLRPGRRYLIEEGDTLPVIAQFELGDATRWAELLYLNRDRLKSCRDPLSPGTWLTLPAETEDSP